MSLASSIDLQNGGGGAGPEAIGLLARWRRLSLVVQFTLVAALVIGITMTALEVWVALRIEASVINHTARAAALYMDRFVEPFIQELAGQSSLSETARESLHDLMTGARVGRELVAIKIWTRDGGIAYSTETELIGKRFPITDKLALAMEGTVAAEFDELEAEENFAEKQMHRHILEIYAPIREAGTQRIIAVAEFYQIADELARELAWTRRETVLIVACLALLMLAALSGIVLRGNRTIVSQQLALSDRIRELSLLLRQNGELRQRVAEANRRASESSERFLRRFSAELHDGAVQLIGLAILRLDGLFPATAAPSPPNEDLEIVRGALQDALTEIRDLSHGFALPELEGVSYLRALDIAIRNHERRTCTQVRIDYGKALPDDVPASIRTCAYRFVQEGLNNAFRHAGGAGQAVELRCEGMNLAVHVRDSGPGLIKTGDSSSKGGLGLSGLRDRIEALGGTMTILSEPGKGTCLKAVLPLAENDALVDGEA